MPYNRPQLCWNVTWTGNATTFADNSTLQSEARGIFIDTDDTVYFTRYQQGDILRWVKGTTTNSSNPSRIMSGSLYRYTTTFVTVDSDVYFAAASPPGRVEKRSVNGSTNMFVAQFSDQCRGLFIDVNNTLYCSVYSQHLVSSVSLNRNGSIVSTRAGDGTNGSAMHQLSAPWGIFIDLNFDLYVADAANHRIQRFMANQLNGTTVAGRGIPNGLNLSIPTDVILDGSSCLYIADNNNNRIVRVSANGYQCLVGCSRTPGSAPNQLQIAFSLRLDSYGNLYVADEFNNRIQKLTLTSNCEGTSLLMFSA